ncbi:hypothetical protein JCM10212_000727 [Sporobolomyces blumeae]
MDSRKLGSTDADRPDLVELLPTVTTDLVPLSVLLDRAVAATYHDLATLLETLPSHPDQHKKQLTVDYVLHARRQVLKVLVLVRWAHEARDVHRAMNVVAFLATTNLEVDRAVANLAETVQGLSGARVRNYDLETAIDVLGAGTYTALPSAIRDAFAELEPLSDDVVLETMRECEQVMRWRLRMGLEGIPPEMHSYTIADGRVTFSVPGLWKASFVYSGGKSRRQRSAGGHSDASGADGGESDDDWAEWYLLGVEFLFEVRDSRGAWNPTPSGTMKQHLLDLCNAQLARRPYLPPPPPPSQPNMAIQVQGKQEGGGQASDQAERAGSGSEAKVNQRQGTPAGSMNGGAATGAYGKEEANDAESRWKEEAKEVRRKRKRDRPLRRGYTFLQRLALSYQLESIYSQAVELAQTTYDATSTSSTGTSLRVEINGERDEVEVGYWQNARDSPASSSRHTSSGSNAPLGPGGILTFSISSASSANSTTTTTTTTGKGTAEPSLVRRNALRDALDKVAKGRSRTRRSDEVQNGTSRSAVQGDASRQGSDDSDDPVAPPEYPPSRISVTYSSPDSESPSPSDSASSSRLSSTRLQTPNLDTDLDGSLNIANLLEKVTHKHARETVERLADELRLGLGKEGWGRSNRAGLGIRVVHPTPNGKFGGTSAESDGDRDGMDVDRSEATSDGQGGVPFIRIPLVGPHEVVARIDPFTGLLGLSFAISSLDKPAEGRVSSEGDGSNGGGNGRGEKLRAATDKINASRFKGEGSGEGSAAWMKMLPEVIAKIRATTILDEVQTHLTLLSLPTVRRLPLPPRELTKFGPLPSFALGRQTFLFVPLSSFSPPTPAPSSFSSTSLESLASSSSLAKRPSLSTSVSHAVVPTTTTDPRSTQSRPHPAFDGFYLAIVLLEDGLRTALVGTRPVGDGMNQWIEIDQVGWLWDAQEGEGTGRDAKGKSREYSVPLEREQGERGTNWGYEIKAEGLRKVWQYCLHRVALFRLEQSLHSRAIPYRSSCPSLQLDLATQPRPFLIVHTRHLVRLPRARRTDQRKPARDGVRSRPSKASDRTCDEDDHGVVSRNAAIRCEVDPETNSVRITLHIRFNPSTKLPSPFAPSPLLHAAEPTPPSSPHSRDDLFDGSPSPGSAPPTRRNSSTATKPPASAIALPHHVYFHPHDKTVVFLVENDVEGAVERLLRAYAAVVDEVVKFVVEETEQGLELARECERERARQTKSLIGGLTT